ncbi:MAG: hypothetical protein E6J40_10190 [Chloroflexi bacterium]|nr:MAG: hypothetical protein E6J40_10190 [Chloroflexota bacterium]
MSFVFGLAHKHDLPADRLLALVGGKAANLAMMAGELGLPVPPGFVITTDACRAYLSGGWPQGLDDEMRAAMRPLESRAGRRFSDPQNPLLLSVRSGAPVSMPGMMDTTSGSITKPSAGSPQPRATLLSPRTVIAAWSRCSPKLSAHPPSRLIPGASCAKE